MKRWIALVLLLITPVLCYSQTKDISASQKLLMAEYLIHKLYVDSIDEHQLVEQGIRGMLQSLDPHSTYYSADQVQALKEQVKGQITGIGIRAVMFRDTLYLTEVLPQGPAAKAGLQVGDRVLAVNQSVVAGVQMRLPTIIKMLRGPKKSKVELKTFRSKTGVYKTTTLIRQEIPISPILSSYLLTANTAYIRFGRFSKNSSKVFKKHLSKLLKQGATQLVLDLRGNSGGLLNEAIELANHFLSAEQRIVYTLGQANNNRSFYARGDGLFKSGKLVILLDEQSASASEIVAGAVQDWDRGILIGRRSFGKGLVQRSLDLADGSRIQLTIARYYTPAGRCIQKPYYTDQRKSDAQEGDLLIKGVEQVDSRPYKTLLKSRTIYGGGGILPDVLVPRQDSIYKNTLYRNSAKEALLQQLAIAYVDNHRSDILEFTAIEQFVEDSKSSVSLLDQVYTNLELGGLKIEDQDKQLCSAYLLGLLKALISQYVWGEEAFYQVMNRIDPVVLKALDLLNEPIFE